MVYDLLFNRGYRVEIGSMLALFALPGAMFPVHMQQFNTARANQASKSPETARRKPQAIEMFVEKFVEHSLSQNWKSQAFTLSQTVLAESTKSGLDPMLLLAVIGNESRFDPTAVGTHGEIGLMQIKPETAKWVANKAGIKWSGAQALFNPSYNVRIGTAYLAMLSADFGSKQELYLTAYNMGSKKLRRAMGQKMMPKAYVQNTSAHYSRIYLEFLNDKEPANYVSL